MGSALTLSSRRPWASPKHRHCSSSGRKGDAQLVNYRVNRNYYIVDRVLDNAQLRLGNTPQQVVYIRRVERRQTQADQWDYWDD